MPAQAAPPIVLTGIETYWKILPPSSSPMSRDATAVRPEGEVALGGGANVTFSEGAAPRRPGRTAVNRPDGACRSP